MMKKLIELASEIVQTQVSLNPMSAADIATSLRQVFSTLQDLQKAESTGTDFQVIQEGQEAPVEAKAGLTPEDSIQNDKVICLECGAEMKQLTQKHLVSHGMNQKEYKRKHGFAMKTTLAAKSLTKARSKAAKKRGLPENLKKFMEGRRQRKAGVITASAEPGTETAKPARRKTPGKKPA